MSKLAPLIMEEGKPYRLDEFPWYMKLWWGAQIAALLAIVALSPGLLIFVGILWAAIAWSSHSENGEHHDSHP